ncbi:MAG: MmgE/PrpD family protein [Streptosporangiales bacterium]
MSTDSAPGLTELLADHVASEDSAPDAALDLAERAVVDTVGVALAATADPTVESLLGAVDADLCPGPATALVRGIETSPRQAALVGGTSAHALDFDDVDDELIGHPSTVLVPAVLAVGDQVRATGAGVLDAYWTGLTVARVVAKALDIASHYEKGWHATATVGVFGAAAATARLRGLPVTQTRHALGIAASLAMGSRRNFGTMTKPLHAGVAASGGVLAGTLAASGFTADPENLESPAGFLALYAGAGGADRGALRERLDPWEVSAHSGPAGLNTKLHPCCYYMHPAADAMLALVADGLRAADVDRVTVTVQPGGLEPLLHHRPQAGLQGKFSMEYAMAACLLDGTLTLSTFTDDAVTRPAAQELLPRITAGAQAVPPVGDPIAGGSGFGDGFAVVSARTRGGDELVRRVDVARGHATRPLTEQELQGKFESCLAFAGLDGAGDLYPLLRGLRHQTSVRATTDQLAAVGAGSGVAS